MKSRILIFIFIIALISAANAYKIPLDKVGGINLQSSNAVYRIEYSQTGADFIDNSANAVFNNSSGYIPFLDAGYSPAYYAITGKNTFAVNRSSQASDTAFFSVYDFDSEPVKYAALAFSIVDRPANSSGDTFWHTETNDSGRAYFYFRAGDKTGAYIIKSYYHDLGEKYISYNTDETEIPAKQWRMISLNKIPVNTGITSAFSGVIPEYIYRWNPDIEEHEYHQKYQSVNNVNPGEGYFVIFPERTYLSLTGQYINDTYTVNLKKGWNQIGNPYSFVSDWNSARIVTPDNRVLTAVQAESEGFIYNKIFWYKDGNYYWGPNDLIPSPQLYVWTGFWIEALKNCALRLAPVFSYAENRIVNLAPKKAGISENWEICVSATGDLSSDKINFFGVNENAQNNFDTYDVKKAPALGELMQLSFGSGLNLCRDIKTAPIATYFEWQINVSAGQNNNTLIEFNGLDSIPAKYAVYLVDTADNSVYNLRETSSVNIAGINSVRKFRALAGLPEYVMAALAPASLAKNLTYAHPNPGPDNNGKIQFRYNISAGSQGLGTLTLKIFDLAGVKVTERQLDTTQFFYDWDCRNDKGKTVRTGVYIYILEYNGPNENMKIIDKFGIIR